MAFTDSRFEIQTDDVMLGQRGELLQYAARPGEQVTIGILEGMQTAIVEAGAQVLVNFNHFFQEVSGLLLPAEDLSVTISRLLLDESGRPLPGTVEELFPSDGRVSVSVGGDAGKNFVNIADAVLDDSGVYAIEVCSECARGPMSPCLSWTVSCSCFGKAILSVISPPYPVGPFSVMCTSSTNSVENFVTVVCSSDSGIISSLDCNYDNSIEAENCSMN